MSRIIGNVHNPEPNPYGSDVFVELLDPESSRRRLYSSKVNLEGAYDLDGVNAGSYLLFCSAWGTDTRYYWEIPVTLGLDESIKINLLADAAQTLQ
ncbi:MAG: hypothetical protein K2X81_23760 [Candidatus Obscuribacterales bacterium]|nr:hypothetical protein [Candidatus Obscuribacterales bacterium]